MMGRCGEARMFLKLCLKKIDNLKIKVRLVPRDCWHLGVFFASVTVVISQLGHFFKKVTSRSLKLQCDYSRSLTLSNVGKLFLS